MNYEILLSGMNIFEGTTETNRSQNVRVAAFIGSFIFFKNILLLQKLNFFSYNTCNFDQEGEPLAARERILLQSDFHRVCRRHAVRLLPLSAAFYHRYESFYWDDDKGLL